MIEKVGGVLHQQKGYDGEGGWIHPQGKSMAMSGLRCGKALVGTG